MNAIKDALRRAARSSRDEQGQMAIGLALTFLVVFIMCATAFDAGVWYFDHRRAQTQAEAAALAAAAYLPSADTSPATAAAKKWIEKNGAKWADTQVDFPGCAGGAECSRVKVSVRRQAPGTFSKLSGINAAYVSASATALVGRVGISSVMPWFIEVPDPSCTQTATRDCLVDYNRNKVLDADTLKERTCPFSECPYGLDFKSLYAFKGGDGGYSGATEACGKTGNDGYKKCIVGQEASGFYSVGSSVAVDPKMGNLGSTTGTKLTERYAGTATHALCDVPTSPFVDPKQDKNSLPVGGAYDPGGYDATTGKWTGKLGALRKFANEPPDVNDPPDPACALRLVIIPVGTVTSGALNVLGIAVFGIANWDDKNETIMAPSGKDCRKVTGKKPDNEFDCGMVWGYLFSDVQPPQSLLQQIDPNSDDPLAPLMIALVD
jgi:Flp pilus assembly protein TadG